MDDGSTQSRSGRAHATQNCASKVEIASSGHDAPRGRPGAFMSRRHVEGGEEYVATLRLYLSM